MDVRKVGLQVADEIKRNARGQGQGLVDTRNVAHDQSPPKLTADHLIKRSAASTVLDMTEKEWRREVRSLGDVVFHLPRQIHLVLLPQVPVLLHHQIMKFK